MEHRKLDYRFGKRPASPSPIPVINKFMEEVAEALSDMQAPAE
jgi:hypothetical protein